MLTFQASHLLSFQASPTRVLKPGGHLVAFGGTRTWHRLASAAEDVGFEIRDSLAWIYGTGFPKSTLGLDTAVANHINNADDQAIESVSGNDWSGWSTTLKPAHEPIVLARKPMIGTVAANLVAHQTGALNIGGCRIGAQSDRPTGMGKWPTNVYLDQSQANSLDAHAAEPVSRYFWVSKPTGAERVRVDGVSHPTVKPLSLMRELTRLVTPKGGTVLEPFAGSGTTVEACLIEGFKVVAIEREASYIPLIQQRIDRQLDPMKAARNLDGHEVLDLFDESA